MELLIALSVVSMLLVVTGISGYHFRQQQRLNAAGDHLERAIQRVEEAMRLGQKDLIVSLTLADQALHWEVTTDDRSLQHLLPKKLTIPGIDALTASGDFTPAMGGVHLNYTSQGSLSTRGTLTISIGKYDRIIKIGECVDGDQINSSPPQSATAIYSH